MSTDTAGIYSRQLIQDMGLILTVCLQDVVQVQPRDPIDFIARWLYKYIDNKLYYEINSDYFSSIRTTIQEDKNRRRASREKQDYLNFQLQCLKVLEKRVSAGTEKRSVSPFSSIQPLDESDAQYTDITGPLRSYTSIDGDVLMPLGSFDSFGKTRSTASDRPMMPLIDSKDISMPSREFVAFKPVPVLPSRRSRDEETSPRESFTSKPFQMLPIRESKDESISPRGSVSSLPDQSMPVPTGIDTTITYVPSGYVSPNFGQMMPTKKGKQKVSLSSPRGSVAFIHVHSGPVVNNKDKAVSHSPRGSFSFKQGHGHKTSIKRPKYKTISHAPRGPGTSRHAPALPIRRGKDKTSPAYKSVIQHKSRQDTVREETGSMTIDDYTISLSSSERTTMTTSISESGSRPTSYDMGEKGKGRPSEEFTYVSLPGSARVSLKDGEPQKSQRGSMSGSQVRQPSSMDEAQLSRRGSRGEAQLSRRGSRDEPLDKQRDSMDEAQRSRRSSRDEAQERQHDSESDSEEIIMREDRRGKQESPISSGFWQADSARRSAMGKASMQSHRESIKSACTDETTTYTTTESFSSDNSRTTRDLTTDTDEVDEEKPFVRKIYKKDRSLKVSASSSRTSIVRKKSRPKFSKAIRLRRKQSDAQDLKELFMIQQLEETKQEEKMEQKRLSVSESVKEVKQSSEHVLPAEELDYDEYGKKEKEAKPEFSLKQTPLWSKFQEEDDDEAHDRFERWRRASVATLKRFSHKSDQSSDSRKSYAGSVGSGSMRTSRVSAKDDRYQDYMADNNAQERKSVDTGQARWESLKRSKDAGGVGVKQGTRATDGKRKGTIDDRHSQKTKTVDSGRAKRGSLEKSKDSKADEPDQVPDKEYLDSNKTFRKTMDGKKAQDRDGIVSDRDTDGRQTGYYTDNQDQTRKNKDRDHGMYSIESERRSRDEYKREFFSNREEKDVRYPGADVKSLDGQSATSKSSKKASQGRKRSMTRIEVALNGEWRYVWTQRAIVFDHPILGELRSRAPRPSSDTHEMGLEGSQCEALYDPELYTVCDRHADDEEYGHRMLVWTGTTWVSKEINNA